MTIADLKRYVDKVYERDPNNKTPIVVRGDSLYFGEFIEDEPASEDNNWAPDGHWKFGDFIIPLPEKAEQNGRGW